MNVERLLFYIRAPYIKFLPSTLSVTKQNSVMVGKGEWGQIRCMTTINNLLIYNAKQQILFRFLVNID